MIKEDKFYRVEFLNRVLLQELKHLNYSDQQIFSQELSIDTIKSLESTPEFAAHLEAFCSRFGRFQDTIGNKLLPLWLSILEESPRSFIDNLDLAEKLGALGSAEQWLKLRQLRNQMVHEYIEDHEIFKDALCQAHSNINCMQSFMENILNDLKKRGYL